MKKIHIKEVEPPDLNSAYLSRRLYEVFLWNSERVVFQSKKAADRFLADTNRFLNECLHELNYLYGEIFKCYRAAWFIIDDKTNLDIQIQDLLINIEKKFELCINRSHWLNGNYNTGNNIFAVITYLNEINLKLSLFYKRKFYYREIQQIEVFARQLTHMEKVS